MRVVRRALPRVLAFLILAAVALVPAAGVLTGSAPVVTTPEARVHIASEIENRRALAAAQLPLWNPYFFGGQPQLENSQALAFYPPHVVLRLFPVGLFLPLAIALHVWLAGVGAYEIAVALDASRPAAVAAGIAVMLAILPVSAGEWPNALYAVAWVPLAVVCAMRSVRLPRFLPAATLVAVAACAVLSGSVRGTVFVGASIAAVYVVEVLSSSAAASRRMALRQFAILAVLVAGITAFQTMPVYALQKAMTSGELRFMSPSAARGAVVGGRERATAAIIAPRSGRALAACQGVVDPVLLLEDGVPSVDGYGIYSSAYARLASLALGGYPPSDGPYRGILHAGQAPTRADLIDLFGADYLIACDRPDAGDWTLAGSSSGVQVYRRITPSRRALWTCAPTAVSRGYLEARLAMRRYDAALRLREPRHVINVRWTTSTTARQRIDTEAALHLKSVRFLGERTWQYELTDGSPENVEALVRHPLVEDTAGIDRGLLRVADALPALAGAEPSEWLLGTGPCLPAVTASVRDPDRHDGRMVIDVTAPQAGVVLVKDSYYPGRKAWVDGRRAEVMRVDLAFTAVRVPAGHHRVALAYLPTSVLAGGAASAITALVWAAIAIAA